MRALFALLPFALSRPFRAFTHTHTQHPHHRITRAVFGFRFPRAKTFFEI